MAQYKVVKKVDFGPYTILGKSGLQSDQVPLNNYAPKVGDIIDGEIGSQVRHGMTITGVVFPIATNGSASTTGQMSTQIIPLDDVEAYTPPAPGNDQPQGNPPTPNPETPGLVEQGKCWFCQNKGKLAIGAFLLLILVVILYNRD